jgi:hypothetical protein
MFRNCPVAEVEPEQIRVVAAQSSEVVWLLPTTVAAGRYRLAGRQWARMTRHLPHARRTVGTGTSSRSATLRAPNPSSSRRRSASVTVARLCISRALGMRLEGFEPPRACAHRLLGPARRPVPPQPPGEGKCSVLSAVLRIEHTFDCAERPGRNRGRRSVVQSSSGPWLHCRTVTYTPLSSRGLGRRILSPETRVRIPVAVPLRMPCKRGVFLWSGERPGQRLDQHAGSSRRRWWLVLLGAASHRRSLSPWARRNWRWR